jgi:hypothetical protein
MNNMEQRHPIVSVASLAIGIIVVVAFLLRSTTEPQTAAEPAPQQTYQPAFPVLRPNGGFTHSTPQTVGEQLDIALQQDDHLIRLNDFKLLFAQWIAEDPEAALAYVRAMKTGPEQSAGILMVLQAIGRTDPERAISLANDMVNDQEQAAIYNSLFATAVDTDIAKAIRSFNYVPVGEGRDNSLRALSSRWATHDDEAALAWANNLKDERERNIARESVLDGVTTIDPARAITLAQQNLTGEARENVCFTAIHLLCERHPDAARDAFDKLNPEDQQPFTATEVARALAGKDLNSATAWTDTLPAGASHDAAVSFMTRITARAAQ